MSARTRIILSVVALAAAFALGFGVRGGGPAAPAGHVQPAAAADAAPTLWTCSMHPQIKLPEFGQCPICFMDLIPLAADTGEGLGPRDLALSASAVALAEIRTAPVERRFVSRTVALVGKVTADETRQRVITARVPGRLDHLYVDYTGRTVERGERVADIYSPDLYRARAELLAAREAVGRGEPGAAANLQSVRERLRLWDLDPEQVAQEGGDRITITAPVSGTVIRKEAVEGAYVGTGQPLLTIADLGRVWVELSAYERDLVWLGRGQTVGFTVTALPGERFTGTIVFLDPVLDERTRTVTVRLEADNPDGHLRPGMLVRGEAEAELAADGRPRHGRTDARPPLVVPASAPLLTGERAVVYLRQPGDRPIFTGREVTLGPRAGSWYLVRGGLVEGDQVVVNGAFKLDSALQIVASPSMMLPEQRPDRPDASDCFDELAPVAVAAYLPLQAALAADDAAAARTAADALREAVGGGCADELHAAAATVAAAADLPAMRAAFEPLSDLLWHLTEQSGWTGEQPLRRFHCPMAFDNRGADWLQLDPTTANPYYGAMMLRCGSEVARLGDGEDGS
ncbi:MAG: efflux RND transporter periplasmic adaptor subunit [Candidatus Krumholzibacteriia bacterium]